MAVVRLPGLPDRIVEARMDMRALDSRYPESLSYDLMCFEPAVAKDAVEYLSGLYSSLEMNDAEKYECELIIWSVWLMTFDRGRLVPGHHWSFISEGVGSAALHSYLFEKAYYPAQAAAIASYNAGGFLERSFSKQDKSFDYVCMTVIEGEDYMDFIDGPRGVENFEQLDETYHPPILRATKLKSY